LLLEPSAIEQRSDLRSAAVHDHDVHALFVE